MTNSPSGVNTLSKRLLTMLAYSKTAELDPSWKSVSKALGELYHPDMALSDAMHHLVACLEEVLVEPRFEVGRSGTVAVELLLAPIKGYHSIDLLGAKTLETSYSVDQFYNAMAACMWGHLRLSRVDWCAEQLRESLNQLKECQDA